MLKIRTTTMKSHWKNRCISSHALHLYSRKLREARDSAIK